MWSVNGYVLNVIYPGCMGSAPFIILCRKLHHPNIITLMGASLDDINSRILFVTNFIDGCNLGTLIFHSPAGGKEVRYVTLERGGISIG